MVDGVGAAPDIIGRQSEHPDRPADPVAHLALAEEGAVTAVVLDHEQPDEKPGGRDDEYKAPPKPFTSAASSEGAHSNTNGTKVTPSSKRLRSRSGFR